MTLTDEERQACYAWALWVSGEILETLDEEGLSTTDDDRLSDVLVRVLQDIAESNAKRRPPQAIPKDEGK
jgi:hypothetical protein